jgi:ArsR family transcriptional regulator
MICSPPPTQIVEAASQGARMAENGIVRDNGTTATTVKGARLLRALAHPVRLMILEALADRSQCVNELNSLVPIAQPHLSQHMAVLRKAELVDCHAKGALRCYYLLRPTLIRRMTRLLRENHPPRARSRDSVLREIRQTAGARWIGGRASAAPA